MAAVANRLADLARSQWGEFSDPYMVPLVIVGGSFLLGATVLRGAVVSIVEWLVRLVLGS